MSSRAKRLFSSLLRIIRSPGRLLPVPFLRQSKSVAPASAVPCDCSHSTLTTLSIHNESVSSADTPSSERCHAPPAVSIDHLPFELLCDCLADFDLDELLPLRLVSKTWFEAVNAHEEYSCFIDHLPADMPSDEYDSWPELRRPEDQRCPYSIDLLKTRLTCSSRPISLRVVTSTLSERETEAIGSLISEHLQRIELLFVELVATSAHTLFAAMQRPAPILRFFIVEVRGAGNGIYCRGMHASIPSDIFSGHTPLLESASLVNAVFDPSTAWLCPAFHTVKFLRLSIDSENCAGLPLMLAQCPILQSLDIAVDGWPSGAVMPPGMTLPDHINSLRIAVRGMEAAQLDILGVMTSPTTHHVSMPLPSTGTLHALFGQLRGAGQLTFKIHNDLPPAFGWTYIQLVSDSTKRLRGIEVNVEEHFIRGWWGMGVLDDLTACGVVDDIQLVHLSLFPGGGFCPLKMFAGMFGTWTAVRTIRIDVLEGPLVKENIRVEIPELVQIVLFHPALPIDAGESEVVDICTNFLLGFFAHSKTDTVAVVLTRDEKTADLVTADPGAATNHPRCIVYRQSSPKIVPEA